MVNSNENNTKGILCSVNICGLSQRSHMMLNKYVFDHDILLLSIQESGSNQQYKMLNDMNTYEDTNKQRNKGCAIMVKKGIMFTQLPELSLMSKNIDTVWGVLSWNGKRYLIGNVYLLEYLVSLRIETYWSIKSVSTSTASWYSFSNSA